MKLGLGFGRARVDTTYYELFEEAARNAGRATQLLREMLVDFPERADLARDILRCEQEGDRIAHDIFNRLNDRGHAPPPFRPTDAYALTGALDDIVDHTEQAADTLGLYAIEAPMEQAEQLTDVLAAAAEAVTGAVRALRTGDDLAGHLLAVHERENEGDRLSRHAIASLFDGGIDPMVVIRWKDIYELLEDAIDACETVAHILEGIALQRR